MNFLTCSKNAGTKSSTDLYIVSRLYRPIMINNELKYYLEKVTNVWWKGNTNETKSYLQFWKIYEILTEMKEKIEDGEEN